MVFSSIPAALRAARKFRKNYGSPGARYVCERSTCGRGYSVKIMQRAHIGGFYFAAFV